jgi:phosphohistidine phosphatase
MLLIIMRHGEAAPYQANDKERELTRFGVSQSELAGKRLAEFLSSQGLLNAIDHVLISPYTRTQQTFGALAEHVQFKTQTKLDAITPMGDANEVHDLIDGFANELEPPKQLMLVSHMPLVSLLSDKVCLGFNGKIFDTADMLIIDYNPDTHRGTQLAFYQSMN